MPDKCLVMNDAGELPDCTWDGQHWSADYPGAAESGVPSAFGAFFVLAVLVGIGVTVWRVSLARDLARRSGMSPGQATAVTLLEDDGLEATYLAANLRGSTAPTPAQPVAPGRTAHERLVELEGLRRDGLLTDTEYQARRQAIVDSL